jgi:hypothetical protein
VVLTACVPEDDVKSDPDLDRYNTMNPPTENSAIGEADMADLSSSDAGSNNGSNPATTDTGNSTTEPSLNDRLEAQVVGSYVFKMEQYSMMEIPFIGPTEQLTTTYGSASIERSADTFQITESGCHVESDAGSSVTTIIPDEVPRSTTATTSLMTLMEVDGQVSWTRAPSVTVIGVRLDDPAADALPSEASDPRVFDQDGDGNPGVTVRVEGLASGDIYVVQRTKVKYWRGSLAEAGQLEAIVDGTNEQSVIGATNPLLQQDIPSTPHSDAEKSRILLRRVEDPYDCDRVTAEAITLFP